MRKFVLFVLSTAVAVFAFGTFTLANPEGSPVADHTMKINLSGGSEVPGPGDPDGKGTVNLTFNLEKGEVCYDITVSDIQAPTAAHIHVGAVGKAGGPKVTFAKGTDGSWRGCASADKALLNEIVKKPADYYVNVHNAEYPGGALRGQLGK